MKIKLNESPGTCPACNTEMTGLSPQDRQCHSISCYLGTDDTIHSAEQMRLMLSWGAAIKEIGFRELVGRSQW
jgi:hypothetical protein